MNPILVYLVESSICLALFYSLYLIFKGDSFHQLKRLYLILSVFGSLLIPQLSSPSLPPPVENIIPAPTPKSSEPMIYIDSFEQVVFSQLPDHFRQPQKSRSLSVISILTLLYLLGIVYFLYRFIRNLLLILSLYNKNQKEKYKKYTVILLPDDYPTFSFFRYIFLNKRNLNDTDEDHVLMHELVHISQKHSIDLLFIEICKIFFWFNPFIWFYKSSLTKVHECLADQVFTKNKSNQVVEYQSLLLKQYLGKVHLELAHPFSYSLIKYRISMMTKNKSGRWAKYKLLFSLPIILFSLLAFANADINLDETLAPKPSQNQPEGMVLIPKGEARFTVTLPNGEKKEVTSYVQAFWIKETEVSVEEYFEYLEALKTDTLKQFYDYEEALPDFGKAPFKNYFTSKKYRNYPMVAVTLKQAMKFCLWKTNNIQEFREEYSGWFPAHTYELPTEAQWIFASYGGLSHDQVVKPEITPVSKVGSGAFNEWGLHNMFDNVSEWIYVPNDKPFKFMPLPVDTPIIIDDINKQIKTHDTIFFVEEDKRTEFLESFYPDHGLCLVKGNNYLNMAPDGNLTVENSESYEYVGFRYVTRYKEPSTDSISLK